MSPASQESKASPDDTTKGNPPSGFSAHGANFYRRGRYLKVWTENKNPVLHDQEFIVLNSTGEDGMCMRVDREGDFEKSTGQSPWLVAILPPDGGDASSDPKDKATRASSRPHQLTLEDLEEPWNPQEPKRFARLEHIYHIIFNQNSYKDLGDLGLTGVKQLRIIYIEHLLVLWGLSDVFETRLKAREKH